MYAFSLILFIGLSSAKCIRILGSIGGGGSISGPISFSDIKLTVDGAEVLSQSSDYGNPVFLSRDTSWVVMIVDGKEGAIGISGAGFDWIGHVSSIFQKTSNVEQYNLSGSVGC